MGHYEINELGVEALFADPEGAVGKIIERKTLNVEAMWKELLLIPGSGRTYTTLFFRGRAGHKLGNTGQMQVPEKLYSFGARPAHTASAAGESPASDSGQLLASIGHEIYVDDVVKGRVYADKEYAIFLEDGTRFMLPRPFMRPGLEAGVKEP